MCVKRMSYFEDSQNDQTWKLAKFHWKWTIPGIGGHITTKDRSCACVREERREKRREKREEKREKRREKWREEKRRKREREKQREREREREREKRREREKKESRETVLVVQ